MRFKSYNLFVWLISCPWKFICRKRKFLTIMIIVLLCLLSILVVVIGFFSTYCSFEEVQKAVDIICDKYHSNEALGNFCDELCETNSLKASACIPNHMGKDVVFEALLNGRVLIIKSSHLRIDKQDQVFWTNETGSMFYPSISSFYSMLYGSIKRDLNLHNQTHFVQGFDLVQSMWPDAIQNLTELSDSTLHTFMRDLWSLVQQPEYLMLKYYENMNMFPKIFGTCSYFYMEEFVQPLDNLFLLFYPAWREGFQERAKLAIRILNYLDDVETNFPALQLCDVKMGHFGQNVNGDIKLIDMDMVFEEPNLLQNMVSIDNCTDNEDCSFIDCKGSCDKKSRLCRPFLLNTNFQRICSNIFIGHLASNYLGLLGLPPKVIRRDLQSLLQKCSVKRDVDDEGELRLQLKTLLEGVS